MLPPSSRSLRMRLPCESNRRSRVRLPVVPPEPDGGTEPRRRPWTATARDAIFGFLLALTQVSSRPTASPDEPGTLISTLICELRGGEPAQKRAAARKLGELGATAREVIPALKEALNDPEVCFDAHEALKRLRTQVLPSPEPALGLPPGIAPGQLLRRNRG